MKEKILQLCNISKNFETHIVLSNVNFTLQANEMHAIIGSNGSGKTLLAKLISGHIQPNSGEIIFNNEPTVFRTPREAIKKGIFLVPYIPDLYPDLDVATNLLCYPFFDSCHYIVKKKFYNEAQRLFDNLNIRFDPHALVSSLNPAEQKLLQILQVYYKKPKIAIFDEPTELLDDVTKKLVFNLVKDLKENNSSIIYISNNLEEIFNFADMVSTFHDGCLQDAIPICETSPSKLLNDCFGFSSKQKLSYPKLILSLGGPLLQVKGLNVPNILHNVSFTIRQREIVGLVGLTGSGRSTIANAICGAIDVNKEIYLQGQKISIHCPNDALNRGICHISSSINNQSLFLSKDIGYNISIGNLESAKFHGFVIPDKVRKTSKKYTKKLGIKIYDALNEVDYLSSGNQQKVSIARALNSYGKVFIMDEPTTGLDAASRVDIYNIINELLCNGAAILLISSDLSEILGMCDRVLILQQHTINKEFLCQKITQDELLDELSICS